MFTLSPGDAERGGIVVVEARDDDRAGAGQHLLRILPAFDSLFQVVHPGGEASVQPALEVVAAGRGARGGESGVIEPRREDQLTNIVTLATGKRRAVDA